MKKSFKGVLSLFLIIALIASLFTFATSAATSGTLVYSKEYNSGERGVVCTTLDGTSASSYYTGSYTYENLSELSSSALKSSLTTLMKSTHSYISSYDDCHYEANRTDCENETGDSNKLLLIYTSYTATMSQWNGWNREHVWPKSLGGDTTTGGGADLHHIRPSDAGVNSSRGNKKYGESGSNPTSKYGTNPAVGVLGGTYNSTYFEPLDNVKGDVARICLYVMVRWGSDWGATDITQVFQSVDVLLEWCEMDPVDTWEMGRNEVVEDIQGNRNVFIDYPEYAWLIYGRDIPDDMTTPSGMAKDGNTGSGSQGGTGNDDGGNSGTTPAPDDSGSGTTPAPDDSGSGTTSGKITFEFGENKEAGHVDSSSSISSYTETVAGYTISITGIDKFYAKCFDALGNSCIKIGSSKATGSFSFTVPADVSSVIIRIAQYKDYDTKISINGGDAIDIKTPSDSGSYTEITVDTSVDKTVTVASLTGGIRAMINSITYVIESPDSPGDSADHECKKSDSGYCNVCELTIKSASLILGENLSLRFGVKIHDLTINTLGAYMVFEFNGETVTVTNCTDENGYLYFLFENISPDQMTSPINAAFILDGKSSVRLEGYTVEANLLGIYSNADDTLKQLIHDTLIYGQTAKEYTGNDTPDIDTSKLVGNGISPTVSDAMTMQGNETQSIKITSVGVRFDCYNSYYVKIYIADTSLFDSVTVDGARYGLSDMISLGDGYYQLYFGSVDATNFDTRVTIELNSKSGTVAKLTYSINAYAYEMQTSTEASAKMKNLALALYRYGKSAEAYWNEIKPQA